MIGVMEDVQAAIAQHLDGVKFMQLATSSDNQPWVVTVLFVHDGDMNIYWLSELHRRHSEDIAANPKVAAAMAVKTSLPVIGLQVHGTAKIVKSPVVVQKVLAKYVAKHGLGKDFAARALKGIAKHRLYKLTPESYRLFDEVHFKGELPVTWKP